MTTLRLTVGQAIVRFLVAQRSERDGLEHRLIEGMFGIFGHGNVAGLGEAVLAQELADPHAMPYYQARNEQGMVHAATGFARQRNRLSTMACLSSIGPGATNMVTGAATATVNRLPVLLLPSDLFATRVADPVLQQLEHPMANDISVNDCFRPVARVLRPRVAAGAAALGAARCDARAHRPGRDRGRRDRTARGCPGGGPRLARGALRDPGVARRTAGPRGGRAGSRGGGDPGCQAAADRERRRHDLLGGHGRADVPWPTRRAFPWQRRISARARCPTTIRPARAPSARPATPRRMPSPGRPTS